MKNMIEKEMTVTFLQFECEGEILGTGAVWSCDGSTGGDSICMGRLHNAAVPHDILGRRQVAEYHSCSGDVKQGWVQFLRGRFVLGGIKKSYPTSVSSHLKQKLG